jgi:hypothetical protein
MTEKRFNKGDRVQFQYGAKSLQGTVKEDRGPIGVKGRHLYLIEFTREPESTAEVELPADQLQGLTTPSRAAAGSGST